MQREACPACRSTQVQTIYTCKYLESPVKDYLESFYAPTGGIEFEYLAEAEFILQKCYTCGLVFQRDIPNDFLMQKLYEEWLDPQKILEISARRDNISKLLLQTQEILMVIAILGVLPSKLTFLDFGMGWGHWCRIAQNYGCEVYGTELSVSRIAHARAHGISVLAWDDIPHYRFDFINTEQVFEHLAAPLDTLQHLQRSLKPDGLIKISVPYGGDIRRRLQVGDWAAPKRSRNSLNPIAPLEHINCFSRTALIKMAAIAGLAPVYIPLRVYYAYSMNFASVKQILKNLLRPLSRNVLRRGTWLLFRRCKPVSSVSNQRQRAPQNETEARYFSEHK